MQPSKSVSALRSEVARSPRDEGEAGVNIERAIDQQLRELTAFALAEGAGSYLINALKQSASRAEQKVTLAERERAQRRRDEQRVKQPADLKSMRRQQAPKAERGDMPLQADEQIDLLAFATLIREREGVEIEDELITKVFAAFDKDGSGTISAHEYLLYSLVEALGQTQLRAVDLFKAWDEDASGEIDEKEFVKAMDALGYAVPHAVSSRLFRELDVDRSGSLKYAEIGKALSTRVGAEATKAELMRYAPGGQQANRDKRGGSSAVGGGHVARDSTNYASVRTRTLPVGAKLEATSGVPVMEQLGALLTYHAQTIIRLFQDWDEDGNGGVSKAEFRRALQGLGYDAPAKDIDALFVALQGDNGGKSDMAE